MPSRAIAEVAADSIPVQAAVSGFEKFFRTDIHDGRVVWVENVGRIPVVALARRGTSTICPVKAAILGFCIP